MHLLESFLKRDPENTYVVPSRHDKGQVVLSTYRRLENVPAADRRQAVTLREWRENEEGVSGA